MTAENTILFKSKPFVLDTKGYRRIRMKDHRLADNQGYVRIHRLIWEEYHKACLLPWSDVHHINKIITDNRI